MAGSAMTFAYDDGHDGSGLRGGIRKVLIDWTSDSATGAVTGTTAKIVGEHIITIPRPRDIRGIMMHPEFAGFYQRIRAQVQ